MADEEKRLLEPIYIKNHDEYIWVCEYFPKSGRFAEKKREEIRSEKITKGYYVRNKDNLIGLFSSPKGPIMFFDREQYLLQYGKCKMELSDLTDDIRRFRLLVEDIEVINVDYEKTKFVNYDPWSDEKMVDFYKWMDDRQDDPKFYNFFTE